MKTLKSKAQTIINDILAENMPEASVTKALETHDFGDKKIYLVAIGKAAWTMTKAATAYLGERVEKGVLITKYGHSFGELPRINIFEAGHPTPDENTITATQKVLDLIENLTAKDEVLFLISGGGSALFEAPLEGVTLDELAKINDEMLASGANIVEINMIRKRLSKVKGGRFAKLCQPASIFAIVLSDVLGDRLDTIASGPATADETTAKDALAVVKKYNLNVTELQKSYLLEEAPKRLENVETVITGSVKSLCESAAKSAKKNGFKPYILSTTLNCEATDAGRFLASIACDTAAGISTFEKPCAIIIGGETVVTLRGNGKGGRNQQLALAAAERISGLDQTLIFSLGSDGTDGPTDAAGGIVDGSTLEKLATIGINIDKILANNDSYHGLQAVDGLIITGPTGTNVNDVTVILCDV